MKPSPPTTHLDFIEIDLTKVTEHGIPLSAVPHYAATDGDPEGGPKTEGGRIVVTVDDWENADKVFLKHIVTAKATPIVFQLLDGSWKEGSECPGRFDFTTPCPKCGRVSFALPPGTVCNEISHEFKAMRIPWSEGQIGFM